MSKALYMRTQGSASRAVQAMVTVSLWYECCSLPVELQLGSVYLSFCNLLMIERKR